MQTLVYIKMDAADQQLLLEGVCKQLGIVTYYNQVGLAGHRREGRP